MKKNRLQQQTLDRFFKPAGMQRAPLASHNASSPGSHEVFDVDEEVMNEVLHSKEPAPTSVDTGDKPWLLGSQQVIYPWSPLLTRNGANGQRCRVWDLVQHVLQEPFRVASSEDLCSLLATLDRLVDGPGNRFEHLRRAVGKLSGEEQTHLFAEVLPWMKATVLAAPELFDRKEIPLLVQGESRRVVFSHEETVALMCCCFFSLFPQRSEAKKGERGRDADHSTPSLSAADQSSLTIPAPSRPGGWQALKVSRRLPPCNFSSLFSCGAVGRDASIEAKIRGFLEYFFCCHRHHANAMSVAHHRCVEFTRASYSSFPDFERSQQPLAPVSMRRSGLIEDDAAALQVDFANRFVGGGVLRSGCVQEEIRMTLAPETVLSRLVCEELGEGEVLFMSGTPNFCSGSGYAEKFRFRAGCDPWGSQSEEDSTHAMPRATAPPLVPARASHPRTHEPMLIHDVCVLAMDAHNFRVRGRPADQYHPPYLQRELHKAYAGYHGVPEALAALPIVRGGPIATGHWGCGAFRGDKELKLLLQWCAASEAGGREMHYYTFDTPLREFDDLHDAVLRRNWTVGQLMQVLLRYDRYRGTVAEKDAKSPLQFLHQVCTEEAML